MQTTERINRIKNWIIDYCKSMPTEAKTLVIGVSGGIDEIYKLATNLTLPFVPVLNSEENNYDMDHSMNLALISPDGKYFGFFKSPHNPDNLAKALKSLITFAR